MRRFQITVNGTRYEVDVEETVGTPAGPQNPASLTEKAPKAKPPSVAAGSEVVKAPMPGTILGVSVTVGQEVKRHQLLCVLEAMKMENEILSPRDGRIASISVSKGSTVNAGSPLVHLE